MSNSEYIEKLKQETSVILAEELSLTPEEIDFDQDLMEYGLDSIMVAVFADEMSNKFGISLNPLVLFEHETLNDALVALFENYKAEITAFYDNA